MLRLIELVTSIASKIIGIFLFVFGGYVTIKLLLFEQYDKISVLSFASLAAGSLIIVIHSLEETGKAFGLKHSPSVVTCGYLILLSSSATVIVAPAFHRQELDVFMSNEISLLWTLRDSSSLYKSIIQMLQNSLDCCKIHSLVR